MKIFSIKTGGMGSWESAKQNLLGISFFNPPPTPLFSCRPTSILAFPKLLNLAYTSLSLHGNVKGQVFCICVTMSQRDTVTKDPTERNE